MLVAEGKTCTVMIAMLRNIPLGEFVGQPKVPRTTSEVLSFKTINYAISDVISRCLLQPIPHAAFGWARPGGTYSAGKTSGW